MLNLPSWPIYDTKRNAQGVHTMKKLIRATRLQQQWAKKDPFKVPGRVYDRAQDAGYVNHNGVFTSSQAPLSALVLIGGDAGTLEVRRNHVTIVRRQRLRGLSPHPRLP